MISSRGLRRSTRGFHTSHQRVNQSSAKYFSAHNRPATNTNNSYLYTFKSPTCLSKCYMKSQIIQIGISRNNGIRFNSTTSTTSTLSPISTYTSPNAELSNIEFNAQLPKATNFDENLVISADEILNAPERIGYLKSIGLDWGWGPTSVMGYVMEHIHFYLGTPWWATITLTAILVRVILLKPYISSAENAAKMAIVNPIAKPVIDKMMAAQRAGDQSAFLQYKQEQSLIYRRAGINPWKSGLPLIQMVLGFGSFRLINGMAKLPVPGLETGGALWLPNLAVPDPLYILPIATAATLHWVMRKGGETGVQMMNPKMLALMKWGLPGISLIFTSWLPAGVQLSFFISGVLSLTQAMLLRQTWFRSYFNMTPLSHLNPASARPNSTGTTGIKVLSSAELNQRFQPPIPINVTGSGQSDPSESSVSDSSKSKIKQIFSGAVTDIKSTVSEVIESGRNLAGQGKKELQGRLDKAELRQRELYEKKKHEEDLKARFEEQRLRKLERQNRKRKAQSDI